MDHEQILTLDPLIHAPVRLAILTVLMNVDKANFTFLKELTETTDGNLSTHLTKLEIADYISVHKTFKGKKPHTIYAISEKGREVFMKYLEQLECVIRMQKVKTK